MRPIQRCPQALAKRSLTSWMFGYSHSTAYGRADGCRPSSLGQNGTSKAERFAVCRWTPSCLDVDLATMTTAELTAQWGVFYRLAAFPVVDRHHGLRGMSFVVHALSLYRSLGSGYVNRLTHSTTRTILMHDSHRIFNVRDEVAAVGAAMYRVRLESGLLMRKPLDELSAAGTRQPDMKPGAEVTDPLSRFARPAPAFVAY